MPNKLQAYAEQAERTARQITGSHLAWTAFLTTAARLYKYPYNEQLMIYMQRPEATACAEYDFWNEKMGRYVRRGSTGIALIDATGYKPRLKYVFDVADTGGRENARRVNLWELKDAHTDSVSAMLERNYGVSGRDGLTEQFESVASLLAAEYWRDHSRDILGIVADSYLEEYDDYNIEVAFKNAAAVSITYSLMSRCGMQPEDHFEHEDFFSIFDFNTPRTVAALGTAVSEINEQVLRQIEVTIRNYEREHSAERTAEHGEQPNLHPERGLPDSRPEHPNHGAAPRQVRADAPEVPEGASAHPLEPDDSGGSPVPAPAGDRAGGAEPSGADDAGAGGGGRSDGGAESPRPDEMGGPDEHLQGAGGGSDSRGADLRISEHPARGGQLSFFPTEAEQIASIEEAESAQTPFAFSVSQEQLDHVLRLGGNEDDTRMVIAAAFQKQKSVEDIAALLRSTFHGGNGFKMPEGELSAWYAVDGIHIAPGRSAEYVRSAQVIAWQDAAAHISQLMDSGAYASNVELAEAGQHERMQLAQALWYLKHDLSDEAREQGYLSCMDTLRGGGFPDETARLAEQLTNTDFRETLSGEFAQFYAAHEQDRSLLRFHYHKLESIWESLRDMSLPRREYSSEMAAVPELARFITEDEIDHALDRGSGVEGGKGRIYEYFTADHTGKEKAAFLKDEYGIGGRSHAVSGASHSDESHDSRGIVLKKAGCANVELSWTKVATRIDSLIQKDRFLSPREKERYAQLQREKEAERELLTQAQIDYNSIKEAHPDDIVLFQVGDFFEMYGEDAKQAAELLALNLTTRAIPSAGRVEMCGIPAHNLEMYVEKLRDKYDVTIAEAPDFRGERHIYTLRSIDHEAEAAVNAYEAEFGADGTRVFRDPAAEQAQPTVQELFGRYRLSVGNALSKDEAFLNACRNSDRQNAYLEGAAAIRRIVTESGDLQLTRLYFDMPAFHNRLHQELLDELYPTLATTITPSPYKVTQEDIDAALQSWNGKIESKQAVVRYMAQHGRERETAAWLAREYGAADSTKPLRISVGSSEPVMLSWPKVQRRLAQLIREDKFFTEQEKSVLEQNRNYLILDRLRADCEYFLGAGNRAEKHLWAGSVYAQIVKMRELYDALPQKPEWLTEEMIGDYADRMAPQYQVVVYHHFENGFDEKLDYQTLEEAEKAAQGYVDGTMESDGFAYDGAAIYDLRENRYLSIFGNYPDERAQAEVAGREPTAETITPADRFHVVSLDRGFRTLYAVWDDETHGYYVDADGVTEEFTSEWQAETYRLELQGQAEQALLERAKGLISDFCRSEYGSEADFSDPTKIGVAYTTVTDDEIPVQVNIDLVNYRLERYLDDEHLETRQYASLQELITNELENLDFSDLIHVSDEDVEQHRWRVPEEAVAEAPETAPAPQRELFPYSVGDTVYLENGKPYIIESVGVFDITLSDPTLFYPISRAESRESFARLMERYPQPEKTAAENTAVPEKEPKPTYTEETVAVYPGDKNNLPYDVEIRTLRFDEPEHDPPAPLPPAENFRILDDDLGTGGAKAKFRANMAAINLLKELELEGAQATPEQQEILSRYVGWGGLADAFDESKDNWKDEFAELYATLSPEEYAAARASTLNAHYTSPTVIKAIYEAVGSMGFQTGNILEPAMGVGNFFGLLPQEMQGSRLYGVELDSITGRIAKQLYPKADITVAGFETTDRKDFFDLAVGNVPFGQYQVNDRAYNRLGFSIHNYFFAKALDQVRPGGVVAFVTSRYTMDAKDSAARKYIAQRADLLGAIRLPNNAFKANAGTEVVSDIIFLQKRDRPIDIEPDWVHLSENEDGFSINQYFIDNPEMVLGRQTSESTQYGRQDFTVEPYEDLDLATQLRYAIQNIGGKYEAAELPDLGENETIQNAIPADPNVKNYSYAVVDGEVYYRENSVMVKPNLNATAKERVKGMAELRDCVHRLIDLQMWDSDDISIRAEQQRLNRLYDRFTEKYGLINSRGNALAFADDSSYYLLCSLEVLDDEDKTKLKGKADMFTKRTIRQRQSVTSVDTAAEALALSIGEKARVDMAYMSQLTGKSEDDIIDELNGVIFLDPVYGDWQTADEYLSGNVRQKLREAENAAVDSPGYLPNVEALRAAQPKDLDASEIEVRLGATWIDKKYIQQFMFELLEPPLYARRSLEVNYSEFTAEWNISGKNSIPYNDINARMTYGTDCANAYKILEDTLNLRDVRIYDTVRDADGKEKRVLNSKETTLAQQKQQAIKEAFRDWIWRDPDRRRELVQLYNERFNSTRPREYDGRHLIFPGMNPEITLREHQLNAIAHDLYGGNTLLAHEVGAGKSATRS